MEEKKEKKRIPYIRKDKLMPVEDQNDYIKNKCSPLARRIKSYNPKLVFDLWFDKHLHLRQQFGDENGKREGIDPDKVEALVFKSMKYLVTYSSMSSKFSFLNHNPEINKSTRIVIQDITDNGVLNVVIEAHIIDIDTYEITVKTAMKTDEFRISMGQYVLEFQCDIAILKKNNNGKIEDIISF